MKPFLDQLMEATPLWPDVVYCIAHEGQSFGREIQGVKYCAASAIFFGSRDVSRRCPYQSDAGHVFSHDGVGEVVLRQCNHRSLLESLADGQ